MPGAVLAGKGWIRFALVTAVVLLACPPAGQAQAFSRQVIGLYHSGEGHDEISNPLRLGVEMVLHHLGLHLDLHDLAAGLPDSTRMAKARGVVVWLEADRLPDADTYWRWLSRQISQGRRVVLLGELGRYDTSGTPVPPARIEAALAGLGLRPGDDESTMPLDIEIVQRNPAMVEFERSLRHEATRFTEMRSIDPANDVLLRLRLRSSGAQSDAVVLGAHGGYAAAGYVLFRDPETNRVQWRIDPFPFFERALGVEGAPRPDPTTRFGHRVYYSHIDGDGLRNRSLIDRQRASAEIVLEDILERYADWPFTVSVITAEVDPAAIGSAGVVELTRRIFALPNVEPASHTFSHPLVWDRRLAADQIISKYAEEMGDVTESGRALLPWSLPGYAFDPVAETVGSCRYIDGLLPAGKTCRVLLWSGNCLPAEEELAALDGAGMLNMNGGDSRFDGDYPSYYYVKPYYRQVGDRFQVHSSNSNENTYTGLWSGPFGGFINVIQTFDNTESPRRVLAANIYYHFYSGEREAAMHALHRAYEWAVERRDQLHPVYASQYAESVLGVIHARIDSAGPGTWRVRDYGACRTVRFDGPVGRPDLDRSRGVLGFRLHQGSLYVHLDSSDDALVALAEDAPSRPYVETSTAALHDVAIGADGGLTFAASSLGGAVVTWANVAGEEYGLTIEGEPAPGVLRADADGRLVIDVPPGQNVGLRLRPAQGR